jgi:hypothetical protein
MKKLASRFVALRKEMMRISSSVSVCTIETGTPAKQAKCLDPLFTVGKARVLIGECDSLEDGWCVDKIKAVILEVDGAFALRPCELH